MCMWLSHCEVCTETIIFYNALAVKYGKCCEMINLAIISLEILVILQEALTRYAPNHHPREYTQAAYYLPFENEEYSWTKSKRIETRKKHRKKYKDDSTSAEMDYGPKRLQCKCTCKRKKDTKSILDYEQNDPCCNCYSKSDAGNRDHITPTQYPNEENNGMYGPIQYPNGENNGLYGPIIQYPTEENNGIYRPTQYPNGENNGIYMPTQFPSASYPSIIYPTFDQSLIDKIFPWLTQGTTQTTKTDNNGQTDKDTATTDERDKYSTSADKDKSSTRDNRDKASSSDDREKASSSDDKDRPSTRDDRDKTSTSDDKDRSSTKEDREKPSTSDDKDRPSTKDDRDKPSTSDDKDRPSTKDDRDKSNTSDDKDRPSTRDDRDKPSTSDDKDRPSTRDDRDKASTSDDKDRPSTRDDRDKVSTTDDKDKTLIEDYTDYSLTGDDKEIEESGVSVGTPKLLSLEVTTGTTLSTYPYVKSEHLKKLFHYLPKKKKCFRDKCIRKERTNRKIGRYYEDDLVERPTIASYLNVNRRRNNVPRKLYKDSKPQYGIIPPDKLALKMNELRN